MPRNKALQVEQPKLMKPKAKKIRKHLFKIGDKVISNGLGCSMPEFSRNISTVCALHGWDGEYALDGRRMYLITRDAVVPNTSTWRRVENSEYEDRLIKLTRDKS
jgi:hypothetical protein